MLALKILGTLNPTILQGRSKRKSVFLVIGFLGDAVPCDSVSLSWYQGSCSIPKRRNWSKGPTGSWLGILYYNGNLYSHSNKKAMNATVNDYFHDQNNMSSLITNAINPAKLLRSAP